METIKGQLDQIETITVQSLKDKTKEVQQNHLEFVIVESLYMLSIDRKDKKIATTCTKLFKKHKKLEECCTELIKFLKELHATYPEQENAPPLRSVIVTAIEQQKSFRSKICTPLLAEIKQKSEKEQKNLMKHVTI